jgi:hypothetical protein
LFACDAAELKVRVGFVVRDLIAFSKREIASPYWRRYW